MENATHCKIGHNWILCCKVILLWWIQEYIKHISTYMKEPKESKMKWTSVILLQQVSVWVRENMALHSNQNWMTKNCLFSKAEIESCIFEWKQKLGEMSWYNFIWYSLDEIRQKERKREKSARMGKKMN